MKLTADDLKKSAMTLADSAECLAEFDGPSDSDCANNGGELLARCALMLRSLAGQQGDQCPCNLATCAEPWEPGCGLGTTAEHARAVPGPQSSKPAGREEALGFARQADLDGVRRNKDVDASIGVFVQPRRTDTHSVPIYTTPSPEPAVEATGTVDGYSWSGQTVDIILDDSVPRWMIGDKIRVTISPTGGKSDNSIVPECRA